MAVRVGFFLLGLWFLFLPATLFAGVPAVNNSMVTDVTTVSFSVIWAASEPSTADMEVFEDAGGTVPAASAIITPHPVQNGDATIKIAAEDNGVMKVMVTGLAADTVYHFRTLTTSKSTNETTIHPISGLQSVTTETQTVRTYQNGSNILPFSNDIIIEPCYLEDGVTPAEGTLLIATVEGGNHPITAFVGDGVVLPNALIDLNNVFGRESNENLDLVEGKNLTLVNFRGIGETSIVTHEVPVDNSLAAIQSGRHFLKTGWNFISIQISPNSNDLQTILTEIWDDVASIWNYDTQTDHWSRFDKSNPFPWLNDLNTLEFGKGYWVEVSQDCSLKVYGALPENEDIELQTGWNQVGYKSIETLFLSETVASIENSYQSIWTYTTSNGEWLRFDKNNPFPWLNNLNDIMPGKAYWVEVLEISQW